MRNTLAFLAAVFLVVLAVGWYLEWYTISPQTRTDGQQSYNVEIYPGKIGSDLHKGFQASEQGVKKIIDGAKTKSDCPCKKKTPTTVEKETESDLGVVEVPGTN